MDSINYIPWSDVKEVTAICDETVDVLILEYKKHNTLYSRELDKEFWFNNSLTPYAYIGLCIYLCRDGQTSILDKYEILDVVTKEEEI